MPENPHCRIGGCLDKLLELNPFNTAGHILNLPVDPISRCPAVEAWMFRYCGPTLPVSRKMHTASNMAH